MKKVLPFILIVFFTAACTKGANSVAMNVGPVGPEKFHLERSVFVTSITGGKKTSPFWGSNVGNSEFSDALISSLQANNLYNNTEPKYNLSVNLEAVKQPVMGASFNVVTITGVNLRKINVEHPVLSGRIQANYTAKMFDHLLANERLRLANEGSIRENIKKIILLLKNYKE